MFSLFQSWTGSRLQVLPHRLRHIRSPPSSHEIFYEPTGKEAQPRPIGEHDDVVDDDDDGGCNAVRSLQLYSEMPWLLSLGVLQEMNMVWLSSSIDLSAMSTTSGEWYHRQSSKSHSFFFLFLVSDKWSFSYVFAAGASREAVQVMQMTTVQFEGVYLNLLKMHQIQMKALLYFRNLDSDCLIFESRCLSLQV